MFVQAELGENALQARISPDVHGPNCNGGVTELRVSGFAVIHDASGRFTDQFVDNFIEFRLDNRAAGGTLTPFPPVVVFQIAQSGPA